MMSALLLARKTERWRQEDAGGWGCVAGLKAEGSRLKAQGSRLKA